MGRAALDSCCPQKTFRECRKLKCVKMILTVVRKQVIILGGRGGRWILGHGLKGICVVAWGVPQWWRPTMCKALGFHPWHGTNTVCVHTCLR